MFDMDNPEYHGALKILHDSKDARDPELDQKRIQNEIEAMNNVSHPNLIEILDYSLNSTWFVSKFYSNGTLTDRLYTYKGNLLRTLYSLRPLVEGVAEIHKERFVHRDIKPENIFIDKSGALILGDFGLVYFNDENFTRISKKYDNVGTTNWMPGWAMTWRIEEVKPTFDVYSLGKLIWVMVSGKPNLPLWYWKKEENNLMNLFPDNNQMWLANRLLEISVVEDQENCLPDAKAFLKEIDKTIELLEYRVQDLGINNKRKCQICGIGSYVQEGKLTPALLQLMDLPSPNKSDTKLFVCSHCGYVQQFFIPYGKSQTVWANRSNETK